MNNFTGRRPSDRAKKFGRAFLDGLDALGTVLSDGPKLERIKEIEAHINRLQNEKDSLVSSLIDPGEYKVSDDYDPNRVFTPLMDQYFGKREGAGRLTKCKGQWSATATIHDCHPACPYLGTRHIAHEFTLRD